MKNDMDGDYDYHFYYHSVVCKIVILFLLIEVKCIIIIDI